MMRPLLVGLLTFVCSAVSIGGSYVAGPAFFLSSLESFSLGDAVDYEARTPLQLASLLLSKLRGTRQPPTVILIMVAQHEGWQVPGAGNSSEGMLLHSAAALKGPLGLAAASTVFTSVGAAPCGRAAAAEIVDELRASLGTRVLVGGDCSGLANGADPSLHTPEDLQRRIATDSAAVGFGSSLVAVFCVREELPAEGAHARGANTILAFVGAHEMLSRSTTSHAALLLREGGSHTASCSQRRVLAASAAAKAVAGNVTCDGACKARAAILEGFLVSLVLLVALISGLCCLMDLDTPTRFETAREST